MDPPSPVAAGTKLRPTAIPFVPGARANKPNTQHAHLDPASNASAPVSSSQSTGANVRESPLSTGASTHTPAHARFPVAPGAVDTPNKSEDDDASGAAQQAASSSDEPHLTEADFPPAELVDLSESRLPTIFSCGNTAAKAPKEPQALNATWVLYADDHNFSPDAATQKRGSVGLLNTSHGNGYDPVLIAQVADLEGFWRLWRFTKPPSACPVPYTYSWFRKDIKPEWENPRNKKGGTVSIVIFDRDKPGFGGDKQSMDDVFFTMLMGCVGECFAESTNTLNGFMLKLRPNKPAVMQLWTSNSDAHKLRPFLTSVRETLGKVIDPKLLQKLEYFSHFQVQAASDSTSLLSRMAKGRGKTRMVPDHTF